MGKRGQAIQSPANIKHQSRLKWVRMMRGYSQSELAELSGVSKRLIQDYEQHPQKVNTLAAIKLYDLACALDCEMENLLEH